MIVRLVRWLIFLVVTPILLVISIPIGILKERQRQKSRLLFTGEEQQLLAQAQMVIADKHKYSSEVVVTAYIIENARIEYQRIKCKQRFDATFSEYVKPKILLYDFESDMPFRIFECLDMDDWYAVDLFCSLREYHRVKGYWPKQIYFSNNYYELFS